MTKATATSHERRHPVGQFRFPGIAAAFATIFHVVVSYPLCRTFIDSGMGTACFIVVGLAIASVGIWFGVHAAKYPFVMFYSLATLASVYLCFRQAPTGPRLALIAYSLGMLHSFAAWVGGRRDGDSPALEDPFGPNGSR